MKNSATINSAIGKAVKALRIHFKFKQAYLASKSNISVKTLANVENGKVGIDIAKLYSISNALGVPIGLIPNLALEIVEKGQEDQEKVALKEILG
jgi:transcriptional regulator with XRE-family HTH domain